MAADSTGNAANAPRGAQTASTQRLDRLVRLLDGLDRHAHKRQAITAHQDLIPVVQRPPLDPLTVHEHAVEAAVVEHPYPIGLAHHERVPARHGRVVEADVGGKTTSDPRPLACKRHSLRLISILIQDVLAGLAQLLSGSLHPLLALVRLRPWRDLTVRGAHVEKRRSHEIVAATVRTIA